MRRAEEPVSLRTRFFKELASHGLPPLTCVRGGGIDGGADEISKGAAIDQLHHERADALRLFES
jgi:hypothetical protein